MTKQLFRVRYETCQYDEPRSTIQNIVNAADTTATAEANPERAQAADMLRRLLEDQNPVTVDQDETEQMVALLERIARSRQEPNDEDAHQEEMRASALRLARTLSGIAQDGRPINLVLS